MTRLGQRRKASRSLLGLITPVRDWLRARPPWQLVLTAVLLLVGGSISGYFVIRHFVSRSHEARVTEAWKHLEGHFLANDVVAARAELETLRTLTPEDPRIERWHTAIDSGSADPQDRDVIRLLMRDHLRGGRLDDASREADKYLAHAPEDYEARCIVAHNLLAHGRRGEAASQMEKVPPTAAARDGINPGTVLHAIALFSTLNDNDRLRDVLGYATARVLPALRSGVADKLGTPEKLQLLELYQQALQRLDVRPDLVEFWVPSQKLVRSVLVPDNSATPEQLLRLGLLQEHHVPVLREFRRRDLITESRQRDLSKEADALLAAVWDEALRKDDKLPLPYLGKALTRVRAGDGPEALRTLDRGLEKCGQKPELLTAKGQVLNLAEPALGLTFLEQAQKLSPASIASARLLAESALAGGRPDKALAACREALKQQPGLFWASRMEGELCLKLCRPTEAAAAFGRVRGELTQDADGVSQYVRSLYACGAAPQADQYLTELTAIDTGAAVLLAGAEAAAAVGRTEDSGRWAKMALQRDSSGTRAHLLYANSLLVRAMARSSGWELPLVHEALSEYERVLLREPNNLAVVNNVVWLQMMALDRLDAAYRAAEPLRRAEEEGGLTPARLETLGVLYFKRGDLDRARKLLERAAGSESQAGYCYHLAEVYHAQKRTAEAREWLERAEALPRSPRESAEIEELRKKMRGEK